MAHSVFLELGLVSRYQTIGIAISILEGNGVGLLQGYKVVNDFIKELDDEDTVRLYIERRLASMTDMNRIIAGSQLSLGNERAKLQNAVSSNAAAERSFSKLN